MSQPAGLLQITADTVTLYGFTVLTCNPGEAIKVENESDLAVHIVGNQFLSEEELRRQWKVSLPWWKRWVIDV